MHGKERRTSFDNEFLGFFSHINMLLFCVSGLLTQQRIQSMLGILLELILAETSHHSYI